LTVKGNAALAQLLGINHQTVAKLVAELLAQGVAELCPQRGSLFSPRMVRDHEKMLKRQRDGGKGGNPALHKVVNHEDKPTDTRYQRPERESTASPDLSTKNEQEKESGNSRRKIPLSDVWTPTVESVQKAESLGFGRAEITREADKFRNHAREHDRRCVNWDAAFDNWCIKGSEYSGRKSKAEGSAKTTAGQFEAHPDSPEFEAWRTHLRDLDTPLARSLLRILNQRQLENRSYKFDSQWPPGHRMSGAA
jgi:hypothetical protein